MLKTYYDLAGYNGLKLKTSIGLFKFYCKGKREFFSYVSCDDDTIYFDNAVNNAVNNGDITEKLIIETCQLCTIESLRNYINNPQISINEDKETISWEESVEVRCREYGK